VADGLAKPKKFFVVYPPQSEQVLTAPHEEQSIGISSL